MEGARTAGVGRRGGQISFLPYFMFGTHYLSISNPVIDLISLCNIIYFSSLHVLWSDFLTLVQQLLLLQLQALGPLLHVHQSVINTSTCMAHLKGDDMVQVLVTGVQEGCQAVLQSVKG